MEEEKKDGTVNISQAQLDELLNQNQQLIDQNRELMANAEQRDEKELSIKPEEVKENTVRIIFIDDKPVQAFVNKGTDERPTYVYYKTDPNNANNQIAYVDVIFNNEDKPVQLPYLDVLRQGTRKECPIKETKTDEWDLVQGKTTQKVVKDFSMEETGIEVPIKVIGTVYNYVVGLPDGDVMEVNERFINM